MRFDLLIRDAEIHDGVGGVSRGDVGVLGDWIAAVGKTDGASAARTIDAKGRVLCPGFIDIHSHGDVAVLADPKHECKVLQGVTTEVFTSCGLGAAPKPVPEHEVILGKPPVAWSSTEEYLGLMKPSVNVVYLAAHGAVRHAVMGMAERPATREEIKAMRALVRGASGLSTGLYYAPAKYASLEETAALAAEAGFFSIHVRDHGRRMMESLDEAVEICARARVPMQVSHLQAIRMNRGRAPEMIAKLQAARDRGLDVTADIYPYDAGSTMLAAVQPEEWDDIPWDRAYLCADGSCIGTKERARTLSGTYLVHDRLEEEVELFAKWEHCLIGSDGLHTGGKPHPRLWGTFPRVLHLWGLGMIPKLTSKAAARLGLKDRGVIREHAKADLVLLSTPRDRATFEEPTLPPEGIDLVVCNGVVTADQGRHTGALPGRVLTK
jgi:N-acyl-D-amino-acid deacylase